ncbi:hypothetical protein LTR85_001699 [Meristemomyces frigidus]|nr:hypothetical protein LTR85_001699 [Meristemomyces frigidus]
MSPPYIAQFVELYFDMRVAGLVGLPGRDDDDFGRHDNECFFDSISNVQDTWMAGLQRRLYKVISSLSRIVTFVRRYACLMHFTLY